MKLLQKFLFATLRATVFGLPRRHLLFLSHALSSTPWFKRSVVSRWHQMLLLFGYNSLAAEWMGKVYGRWPYPLFAVQYIQALLFAKRTDEANAKLVSLKDVLADPRGDSAYKRLLDAEVMIAIETRCLSLADQVDSLVGMEMVTRYCYTRAWESHATMMGGDVAYFLDFYLASIDHDPATTLYVCDHLYQPNGLWADMLRAIEAASQRLARDQRRHWSVTDASIAAIGSWSDTARRSGGFWTTLLALMTEATGRQWSSSQSVRNRLEARRLCALSRLGRIDEVVPLLPPRDQITDIEILLEAAIFLIDSRRDEAAGLHYLKDVLKSRDASFKQKGEAAGRLALYYEERRDFDSARRYYAAGYRLGGVPYFLPEYLWRYASLCMAFNDWGEAVHVMRTGLKVLWAGFRPLARTPIHKRLIRGELIPPNGAFFLGCWGIGDDILRLAILEHLRPPGGRYGFSCDPRLKSLFERALPDMEFVSNTRINGPYAISPAEYWREREGRPPNTDSMRAERRTMEHLKRYPDVALSEDLLVAFIACKGTFRRTAPLLTPLPDKTQAAQQWLATLPRGLNVGVSWRGGVRDPIRDRSYTDILDWDAVLSLPGINFINLQYSWESRELDGVAEKFGCMLHNMPGVDLKNDLEEIIALCTAVDVVLTPGTALREMAAATGARVWSLTTTPFLADLWRIGEDGVSDVIFPSMIHLTAMDHGDADGVLREAGRRLAMIESKELTCAS